MAEIKTKKLKVGKQEESEPIDEQVALSIDKLSEIQEQLDKINDEESDEVLEVEKEFNKIRKPVYERRNEVIKSIPDFWFTAFAGHPALNMLISEEDQKILKHLKSLDVDDIKNVKAGYSITFTFEPNPYFENTELVKTYTFLEEGTAEITATAIEWKEGKNVKEPNIGVDHEKEGKKRALDVESFFTWFSETRTESLDNMQDDIAEIIKDDLWTNPLSYATMDEDGDESEVEDEEEEDNEEEDENDGANDS